jgi:hypothetical protein
VFFRNFIGKIVKRRLFLATALLFSFLIFKAQTSFDINDPRNPQCPCHKYQKLADDEYKKLLRTGNKGNGEFVGIASSEGDTHFVSLSNSDKIHKTRIGKYRKQKHKIKDKTHRPRRWIYEFKNWDIWKCKTHSTKCPIWNR